MSARRKKESHDIDKLYRAFEFLWWDYHSRFHKDTDNMGGYRACVEWPCVYIENALK